MTRRRGHPPAWHWFTLKLACECTLYGKEYDTVDLDSEFPCPEHGDQKVVRKGQVTQV